MGGGGGVSLLCDIPLSAYNCVTQPPLLLRLRCKTGTKASNKMAGSQPKVEYIQRRHVPKIRTLYNHIRPVWADRGPQHACH